MKIAKKILDSKAESLVEVILQISKLNETITDLKENQYKHVISSRLVEDCDDDYQEQLEVRWELRDRQEELACKQNEANTIIDWFTNNGYPNALIKWMETFHPECLQYIKEHNKHN